MCGIAGIVDFRGRPVDRDELVGLRDALAHRGPDDAGIYLDGGVGLATRRLAVIDLSDRGHQPMSDEEGQVWITHNGEVYNFRELREELVRLGHRFRSGTDSEVVLNAYKEWGERCPERLAGMFAFAIWDAREQKLFAARDRLGVKPFCYTVSDGRMVFASEVHALYRFVRLSLEAIDPTALDYYLAFGSVPPDRGFVRGIEKLPPAHALTFTAEGVRLRRYWRLAPRPLRRVSFGDALDAVDTSLRRAVERRLVSDVPIGCFLSGGTDSGLVVSYAAGAASGRLKTFTVSFAGAREDEGEARLARLVAGRFETDHTDLHVGYGDRTLLSRMAWHFGEPFADISALAVHQISKAAREHITVALTGDGGDESFCGYANVRAALVAERMRRLLPGPVRTAMHTLLGQGAVRRRLPAAARFDRWLTRYVARPASGQYDLINHWDAALRQSLYVARALPEAGAASVVESVQQGAGSLSDAELHLYTDVRLRLPADYLTKVDIASNMASLEVRSPFLDHEVMELAASLPLSVRMRGWRQKALLRALVKRRLPPELASAPKRGFGPPLGRWLRREWADLVDGLVDRRLAARDGLFDGEVIRRCVAEHRAGIADHTQRLWTLAALELWLELFVDRSLSPGDAV